MSSSLKCPHCGEKVDATSPADSPAFPFCSPRCKMTDLGKWFSEEYRISRPPGEEDDMMLDDEARQD